LKTVSVTLREALELNREVALDAADSDYQEVLITV